MWLEIREHIIIGLHSDRCENKHTWVEYDGDATIGDRWQDNAVLKQKKDVDGLDVRRHMAHIAIVTRYPLWKQLNILRKNDSVEVSEMGQTIDAIRDWSNDMSQPKTLLKKITK